MSVRWPATPILTHAEEAREAEAMRVALAAETASERPDEACTDHGRDELAATKTAPAVGLHTRTMNDDLQSKILAAAHAFDASGDVEAFRATLRPDFDALSDAHRAGLEHEGPWVTVARYVTSGRTGAPVGSPFGPPSSAQLASYQGAA